MSVFLRKMAGYGARIAARMIVACASETKRQDIYSDNLEDQVLTKFGYKKNPLWGQLPSLQHSCLDASIIIPCYNAEQYLPKLLDSALNQHTKYNYEIIAVDDGSKDGTLTLLNNYASRFPNLVVYHQDNAGISMARNKGIELAKGEYVGFADQDDCLSLDFIEILLNNARQYNADMTQCGYIRLKPDDKSQEWKTPDCVLDIKDADGRFKYISGLMWRSLYRKSCFEKVRFPEHFFYEDMINRMVFMRTLKRVAVISDVLYYYYDHDSQTSKRQEGRTADIRMLDQYWLAKSLMEFTMKDLGYEINDAQYRQLLHEWGTLLWRRTRGLDKKLRKEVFILASSYLCKLNYSSANLSDSERIFEKSLKKRNFIAWELMSVSCIALSEF